MNFDLDEALQRPVYGINDCFEALSHLANKFPKFKMSPTGSAWILDAGDDVDIVVKCRPRDLERFLKVGFSKGGGDYPNAESDSLRSAGLNVILVYTEKEYTRWRVATEVCRTVYARYHHLDKATRISIFDSVRQMIK